VAREAGISNFTAFDRFDIVQDHFVKTFSFGKLCQVWTYVKTIVDWDRTSDLGKWFLTGMSRHWPFETCAYVCSLLEIYANYLTEIFFWCRFDEDGKVAEALEKDKYLDSYFDSMTLRDDFVEANVGREDFAAITEKKNKDAQKEAISFMKKHEERCRISRPAPAKRQKV
jgi:hypothetical protein